jgi:hypothetical protein
MRKTPARARTRVAEAPSGAFLVTLVGLAALLLIVVLVVIPR